MKTIWKRQYAVDEINRVSTKTIHTALGIRITEVGTDFVTGTLPVDERTFQPMGFLHGGASAVLAESLGSIASCLVVGIDFGGSSQPGDACFGIELNISHLKSVRSGEVRGVARAVSVKKHLHVWEVKISDAAGELVSLARLTVMVKEAKA